MQRILNKRKKSVFWRYKTIFSANIYGFGMIWGTITHNISALYTLDHLTVQDCEEILKEIG